MSNLHLPDSSSNLAYCRKQKSLGLLCSNFLGLYNRDDVHYIGLDEAASRLGVERRRIYDIVNVLESVGILCRKAKNQYSWIGFSGIPKALRQLKEEGLKRNSSTLDANDHSRLLDNEDDSERCSDLTSASHKSIHVMSKSSASVRSDNRREKSLALLTQNFVKLFVCSNANLISLDEAARLLLGDPQSISLMRTKVRRLYDIANVLASIHLIEKTHTAETKKPAFRWLGLREKVENRRAHNPIPCDSNKRAFGSNITNINLKRNKLANSFDLNKSPDAPIQKLVRLEGCRVKVDGGKLVGNQNSRSFKFGPFSPIARPEVRASKNGEAKRGHIRESLPSTYHPQYRNQALRELFTHYKEAWKSWYSETMNRSSIQIPEASSLSTNIH